MSATMQALFTMHESLDSAGTLWSVGGVEEANPLLAARHYLGPLRAGGQELIIIGSADLLTVAVQVWRSPTSRRLPSDGSWLELSRWCLTPEAGPDAGSRMHRYAVRTIRQLLPAVTTLVSYSDPSHGHTGALYRACNWVWRPTWLRLRTPPTGNGSWTDGEIQATKDRWAFALKKDARFEPLLRIDDMAAARHWASEATDAERKWARSHPQLGALS